MRGVVAERTSDRQATGVNVVAIYGASRTGKTYFVINKCCSPNSYFKLDCSSVKNGKLWFDGYEGQPDLILDDFDDGVCAPAFLKNLTDPYKLRLETKGSTTWAGWTTVYFTSNVAPRTWFPLLRPEDQEAIKNRIKHIFCFSERRVYHEENWEGERLGDDTNISDDMPASPPQPQDPPANQLDQDATQLDTPINPLLCTPARSVTPAPAAAPDHPRTPEVPRSPPRQLRRTDSGPIIRGYDLLGAPIFANIPMRDCEIVLAPDTQFDSSDDGTSADEPPRPRNPFIDDEASESDS